MRRTPLPAPPYRASRRVSLRTGVLLGATIMAVVALVAGGWLLYQQRLRAGTPSTGTAHSVPVIPPPSQARTSYTNHAFGYTLRYPTDWELVASADTGQVQVFIAQTRAVPQGVGFDIDCAANPSGLNAKQWRQVPSNAGEVPVGYVTLASGTQAYKVSGRASGGVYDVFTTVHQGKACVLGEYETDPANTKIIEASINSFIWN